MSFSTWWRLGVLLLLALPVSVLADEEAGGQQDEYGYWSNFYRIPAAAFSEEIFTLDGDKLQRNALAVGAVALVYTQDEEIRDYWMDHLKSDDMDDVTGFLDDLGSPEGGAVIHGVTALSAWVLDDDYLMDTTALSVQSVLLSQAFAETSKRLTGRERPRDSGGDSTLWGEKGMSFFSGHASGAFAAMTVFAERYKHRPLVYWSTYGVAAATALSRINEEAHWASDTLAGSLVGWGLGHLTLRYSPFETSENTVLLPSVGEDQLGLMLHHSF
ncbi:phosphatase PAP2 family protein [Marinospirillum perlucidum]|uniref:phosphatase PAP2 family protein n=1 Tax=Marinospirillum perlucidum TaxID=1982602 RepID=UPI000DF290BF|nr:phosphatase PAP2 family protein [Marinospirillum perlucidum]